jgi:phosphomethylpyrimidine synthase
VRKYAAEHGLTNDAAIKSGLREKAEEFAKGGAEIYAKT